MPEGISKDSPGWVYGEDGWQHDPMAAVKEKVALNASEVMDKDLSEFGFNSEELQAQEDQIIRQAAEAKAKAMQQMAGRGLSGSGLEIAGLGNIDVGAISAMTDLKTENKALQIEQRLNEIKTYLSAYGSQLDDETRNNLAAEAMELQQAQFDQSKIDQDEADQHTMLNNILELVGGEEWDPNALAWAYEQLDAGKSIQDVLSGILESSDSTLFKNEKKPKNAEDAKDSTNGTPPVGIPGPFEGPNDKKGNYFAPTPYDGPEDDDEWFGLTPEEIHQQYAEYAYEAAKAGLPPLSEFDWGVVRNRSVNTWNLSHLNKSPQ